jgi:hypothetical protein
VDSGRSPTPIASIGELGEPDSIAVERTGRVWLLDRRGTTIATVAPGARAAERRWESQGAKLTSLVWDGRGLAAIDTRGRDVVRLDTDQGLRSEGIPGLQRPVSLAVDAAGRLAVLDERDGAIRVKAPGRGDWSRLSAEAHGAQRPAAIGFGADGAIQLFDDDASAWIRLR